MTTTEDLVQLACPRINTIGAAFYFAPETLAVGKELGLDEFQFYLLGRGGVLGDVEPEVITSAFGFFSPATVRALWTSARAHTELTARQVGRRYLECAGEFGRLHFSELAGLREFCAAAEQVNAATDRAGLALYTAIDAEPLADDLPARAMQLTVLLREFRGSAHVVAVRVTPGLEHSVAHGIHRPDAWTLFGYDENDRPAGTDAQRSALAAADELTDQLVSPAYAVLDDTHASALLTGLSAMQDTLPG